MEKEEFRNLSYGQLRREEALLRTNRKENLDRLKEAGEEHHLIDYNLRRWFAGGFPNLESMMADTIAQLLSENKNLRSRLIEQINCSNIIAQINLPTHPILLKAHGDKPCIGPGCLYCDEEESKS